MKYRRLFVVIGALALCACDETAATSSGAGAPSSAGSSVLGGASGSGSGSGGGGTPSASGDSAGGANASGASLGGSPVASEGGGLPGGNAAGGVTPGGGTAGGTTGGTESGQGGAPQAGTGTGGSVDTAPLPDLRITSDTASIEFTPVLVAAESFYTGKASVGSGGIVTLLNDDTVDLGSNAETQSLRQSVDHPNLRIIFTVTETFYRIVASRAAGVSKLADLKGKSIATLPNTSAAYYVSKMLGTAGLVEQDVTIRSGSAETLPDLIANGTVAAVTLWEPSPQIAMDRLGSDAIEFQDRAVYREIVSLHSTSEKLADPAKRRGIVAFVRSLIKAQQQFREQPDLAKPRVTKALGMDAALLDKVWHNEQWLGALVPDILDVLVEEEAWVAKERNRTPRTRAELTSLVDDSIAKEALATP